MLVFIYFLRKLEIVKEITCKNVHKIAKRGRRMEDWLEFKNKVCIITGGSRGIGEVIIERLLDVGAKVVNADMLNSSKENSDQYIFVKTNVASKESVDNLVRRTLDTYGRIDALVNNAGVSRPRLLVDYYGEKPEYELSEDDFDFMTEVNQKGVFLCSQAVARVMVKQRSGVIINMSSDAGLNGSLGQSCYSATKAAVSAFVMSWAKELGKFNIRVIGVAPSINVRTPMNDDVAWNALAYCRGISIDDIAPDYKKIIPLGRPGELIEVADLIVYLISDRASYISGTTINISGAKSTR